MVNILKGCRVGSDYKPCNGCIWKDIPEKCRYYRTTHNAKFYTTTD